MIPFETRGAGGPVPEPLSGITLPLPPLRH